MLDIMGDKYSTKKATFDEPFYKHFIFKLFGIQKFEMGNLLYTSMVSVAELEPGILFLF